MKVIRALELLEELLRLVAGAADGCRGLFESRFLFGCEVDLEDLLDTVLADNARHTDEQSFDAVLALAMCGAGDDLPLVVDDRFGHVQNRPGR